MWLVLSAVIAGVVGLFTGLFGLMMSGFNSNQAAKDAVGFGVFGAIVTFVLLIVFGDATGWLVRLLRR